MLSEPEHVLLADEHITPSGFIAPRGNILYIELTLTSVKRLCICQAFYLPGHTHKPNPSEGGLNF